MFKWEKQGQLFDPFELKQHDWIHEYAQSPCVVNFDKFLRIYFCARSKPDSSGNYISRLGYIDVDKNDLFKILKISAEPILPIGDPGEFDEFGTYPVSVLRDRGEIVAYYAGWTRCESVPFNAAIGLAKSHDGGSTFTRVGCGPVLSFTPEEPFILGSPRVKRFDKYLYLWYASGRDWVICDNSMQPVYKIRMARSLDGINWERNGHNLLPDVLEKNECQASAEVIFYSDCYHMFFSYRYNFGYDKADRSYRIGYAQSRDLENWIRDDRMAGIFPSASGWDAKSVSYPHIFQTGGNIYMLYQGNDIGKNGFGLAKLKGVN